MNTEASNDLLRTGSAYSIARKRPPQSSALPLKRLASSSLRGDDHSLLRQSRGMSNPHLRSSLSAITPTPTKKQRVVSADDDTKATYDYVNVGADAAAVEAATALAAIGMPRRPGHMAHANSQAKAKSTSFQQKENLEHNRCQQWATSTVNNHPAQLQPYSSHDPHYHPRAGSKHTISHMTNSYSELRKEQPTNRTSRIFVVPPSSFKKAHQHDGTAINSFACAPYSSTGYSNIPCRAPFSSSGVMSNKNSPHGDSHCVRMLPPPPRHSPLPFPPGSDENTMSVPITPQHQDHQQEQFRWNGFHTVARRAPQGSGSGSVRVKGASMSRYQVHVPSSATFNHSTEGAGDGTSVRHGRFTHGQAPKAKPPPAMIVNDHSTRAATPAERRDDHAAVGTADDSAAVVRTIRREGSLCSGGGAIIRSHGDGPPAPSLSLSSSSQSRTSQIRWFPGHTSLALPGDDDVLSPLHCFMRRHCVEAFSATADDVCQPRYGKSHGNRVSIGQVGIRCLHCRYRPAHERADRAVCYPSTIKNIYHSMETWQRRHSALCRDIPQWVREKMRDLVAASRSGAGGRRQYWVDAALRLGLVDTPEGVRFGRDPSSDEFRRLRHDDDGAPAMPVACAEDSSSCIREEGTSSGPAPATVATTNTESSRRIVSPDDKDLVNEHLYLLMEQMEPCRFSEADRTGGRSKVKDLYVGYPGLQCRHCQGKAGFGRYFPSSVSNLTLANSDRNIHNHMMKCRKCPAEVKSSLSNLQRIHSEEGGKSKRGSRKIFFTRIWTKLHPGDDGHV